MNPTRIPEGRLDKARFYFEAAQREVVEGRLQSAENLLRLATTMDPASGQVRAALEAVVRERARRPS